MIEYHADINWPQPYEINKFVYKALFQQSDTHNHWHFYHSFSYYLHFGLISSFHDWNCFSGVDSVLTDWMAAKISDCSNCKSRNSITNLVTVPSCLSFFSHYKFLIKQNMQKACKSKPDDSRSVSEVIVEADIWSIAENTVLFQHTHRSVLSTEPQFAHLFNKWPEVLVSTDPQTTISLLAFPYNNKDIIYFPGIICIIINASAKQRYQAGNENLVVVIWNCIRQLGVEGLSFYLWSAQSYHIRKWVKEKDLIWAYKKYPIYAYKTKPARSIVKTR